MYRFIGLGVLCTGLLVACGDSDVGSGVASALNADGTCSDSFMTALGDYTKDVEEMSKKAEALEEGELTPSELQEVCGIARSMMGKTEGFVNKYKGLRCEVEGSGQEFNLTGENLTNIQNAIKKANESINAQCK